MSNSDTTLDQATISVDDLLDGTLDDLADLPEFGIYPVGAHKVKLHWDLNKEINKVKYVSLEFTGIETVELPAGSEASPISKDQKANTLFDLKNEWGQGAFKAVMASLAAHYGSKSNRELCKESEGAEALITVKHRKDKKDTTKVYMQLDTLAII